MWFLTEHPSRVEIVALAASLPKSYQHTTQFFRASSESADAVFRICVPFPWSPEKPVNGGMRFAGGDNVAVSGLLGRLHSVDAGSCRAVAESDVKVYRKVLGLKNDQPDVSALLITDLAEKYSWDDWGFMTFEVKANEWYSLNYVHKISVYSTLNIPAILPVNLIYKNLPISVTVYAANGQRREKQSFLDRVDVSSDQLAAAKAAGFDTLDCYRTTAAFNGDSDICICTCNWESSDDDLGAGYSDDD